MGTRRYDFLVNVSTSDAPTAGDPSATGDTLTLGYADRTYARRRDFGWTAASYAALKALTTTGDNQRYDGQVRLITDTHELWEFRSASSATDDGTSVLAPDSGTGRWHILSADAAGAGGSANNLDLLAFKLEQDILHGKQTKLDDSVAQSFLSDLNYSDVSGCLAENYTSGGSTLNLLWDPKVLRDADQNIDSITSWTAVNGGTNLAASSTAGDFKVGSNGLKFDKTTGNTLASIRFDRGSQNLSLSAHWRMFFYIKLPSLTNLTNVFVRVYADSTSNYAQYDLLSNYNGTALAADWNWCFVDLSRTPTSTGGTGWNKSQLVRYVEIGVTASTTAQTYTGICVDSVYWSFGDVRKFGVRGSEHTLFDSSNRKNIIVDSGNVSADGILTLAASTNASFTGGLGGTGAGRIKRSTMAVSGSLLGFNRSLTSGDIANQQEIRISSLMRESKSGNFEGFIDIAQREVFEIASIGASAVSGLDLGNVSANCVSGNTFDVFSAGYHEGNGYYIHKGSLRLTGASSFDSSNQYINLPVTSVSGLSVGDFLAKRAVTGQLSLAASGGNESFQAEDLLDSPNNIEIVNAAIPFPQLDKLVGYYDIGGYNDQDALAPKYKSGLVTTLSKVGTPSLNNPFSGNKFFGSGFGGSNYLRNADTSNDGAYFSGATIPYSCLFWLWMPASYSNGVLHGYYDDGSGNNGWYIRAAASNQLVLTKRSGGSSSDTATVGFIPNAWNLVALKIQDSAVGYIYCSGNRTNIGAGDISYSGTFYCVFGAGGSDGVSANLRMASYAAYYGASDFSTQQLDAIYSAGNYRPFDLGTLVRYRYELNSASGQRISMKATVNKDTSVFSSPYIQKLGAIKTS
jgi:hypothetical protein